MKILSGLKEIGQTLRLGREQVKILIREEKTPVKLQGNVHTVFEDDLLNWYRNHLNKS